MSATTELRTRRRPSHAPSIPARAQQTPAPIDERRERILDACTVALPAALTAALCLYQLTARSLWLDEAATFSIVSQHGAAFGAAVAHDGGNMLGYYALMHVLVGAFGGSTFVLRIPSAIAATVTVTVTAVLGLGLFGRRGRSRPGC